MKYIVMENEGEEFMIILPDHPKMSHARMAEAVEGIRVDGPGDSWCREFRTADVVSAGFITISGSCEGYSETLKIGSRPKDDELLKSYR